MYKQINSLLITGLIGTIIFGAGFASTFYRSFWGEEDIWWTPRTMGLSIEERSNIFEMYIAGELLQKRLSEGTLLGIDKDGIKYPVVSKDISIRLNNWNKVRASILVNSILSAFLLGISVTLLTTGLVQVFSKRSKDK